jgi:hypothetical protein
VSRRGGFLSLVALQCARHACNFTCARCADLAKTIGLQHSFVFHAGCYGLAAACALFVYRETLAVGSRERFSWCGVADSRG